MEIGGSVINFLDLTISIEGNEFIYDIYRKPTTTDFTIHGSCYWPLSHKLAAYHYFVNRLVSIPLSPFAFNKVVSIIKYLARKNEIRLNIDDMIRKKPSWGSLAIYRREEISKFFLVGSHKKYEGKMKKYVEIMKNEEIRSPIHRRWDLEKFRSLSGVVADLWRHGGGE